MNANLPTLQISADFQTRHPDDQFLRYSLFYYGFHLIFNLTYFTPIMPVVKTIYQYVLPIIYRNKKSYIAHYWCINTALTHCPVGGFRWHFKAQRLRNSGGNSWHSLTISGRYVDLMWLKLPLNLADWTHVSWQGLHLVGKSKCRRNMNESEMT